MLMVVKKTTTQPRPPPKKKKPTQISSSIVSALSVQPRLVRKETMVERKKLLELDI